MQNTGVIDRFLDIFARYIDSGFGLISGDVGFLASSLIVIDVTLALLGRERRHPRAAGQEDTAGRFLRFPDLELERARPDHLLELLRSRPSRGGRRQPG